MTELEELRQKQELLQSEQQRLREILRLYRLRIRRLRKQNSLIVDRAIDLRASISVPSSGGAGLHGLG